MAKLETLIHGEPARYDGFAVLSILGVALHAVLRIIERKTVFWASSHEIESL